MFTGIVLLTRDSVSELEWNQIRKIKPQPIARHGTRKIFIFRELASSPYVFLRNDTVKSPLQPPYDGSCKVIQRRDKTFTIEISNKNTIVSIDRLKPAFVITDDIEHRQTHENSADPRGVLTQPETQSNRNDRQVVRSEINPENRYVTHAGRKVRFSERFQTD